MLSFIIATTLATLPAHPAWSNGPQPTLQRCGGTPCPAAVQAERARGPASPGLPAWMGDGNHPDDKQEP